jgi:hypothetical protein
MTLKKAGSGGVSTEASISLPVRVDRWGNDGVGLEFVVHDPSKPRAAGQNDGVDAGELVRFFAKINPKKD